MSFRLTGLVAAPYTPFKADGGLNLGVIPDYAQHLIQTGVNGVFICGSTGEGHSLSVEERMSVAEGWVTAANGRFPVVVHVGHNCQRDARTLAAHACEIKASAIAALAPSYYKPRSVEDLIDFLAPIAAAASLPFYFYHIPSMTDVRLPMPQLLREGRKRIRNFRGLKFTHNDLMELQECLTLGEFDVVFGFDEMLLAGLTLGCKGAVGSTYNFAAPIYQKLLSAFERGDFETARREQRRSVELVRTLYNFGLMRAGKALMAMTGIDCGPVRPPLNPMTDDEAAELRRRLPDFEGLARPVLRAPVV
jgi:N-acetylneuraminate lyase